MKRLHEFVMVEVGTFTIRADNKITIDLDSIEAIEEAVVEERNLPYSIILTKCGNYIKVTTSYDEVIALWKGEKE